MHADDGDDEDYVPPVDVPPERVFYLLIIFKTSLIKREFQRKMLIQSFWYIPQWFNSCRTMPEIPAYTNSSYHNNLVCVTEEIV